MIKKTIILAAILMGSNLAHGNETISTKAGNIIGGVIGVSGVTGLLQCTFIVRYVPGNESGINGAYSNNVLALNTRAYSAS
jgi:hypothetical protein